MARQHNSKETRDLIISSAIDIFIEKGYSKTTLEDIVKGVGLTRGAFYWNFNSKNEILMEIVSRYEDFYRNIYENIEHFDSAFDTMRAFLIRDLKVKNTPNHYVTIIRYKVEASQAVSDLRDRQKKLDEMALDIIRTEIERGQKQREFSDKEDSGILSMLIFSFLLGFDSYNAVHNSENENGFISDLEIENFVDLILKNLI
jgi:AcrR family transcriptional regulator